MTEYFSHSTYKVSFALAFLAGFFIVAAPAHAANLFSDGFESNNFNLWSEVGGNWDAIFGAENAHEGNYRADGGGGTDAMPLTKYQSTEGYSGIVLTYWYRLSAGYENTDTFLAEYTIDGGSNWTVLRVYSTVDETAVWVEQSFSLPTTAADNPQFGIRFSPHTNAMDEELHIDSVSITGEEIKAPADNDGDGVADNIDNCPNEPNENQYDFDTDGIGDACDPDDDNDNIADDDENEGCEFDADLSCGVGPIDADNDGVTEGDFCSDTRADEAGSIKLTPNHWRYGGTGWLVGLNNGGGNSSKTYTMADTRGCGCDQIINFMSAETGEDYGGLQKFGCTAGLIEDFMSLVW